MAEGQVNFEVRANASDFTSEMEKAKRSVSGFDKNTEKAAKSAKKLGDESNGIDKLKASFTGLGTVVAGLGVGLAFRKMIDATSRQDAALAQLNATLASTDGAAGKTAEELIRAANSLEDVSRFGDEAITQMQSLLLTFKEIKGDNFDRTSVAVLDMATAMGTDLKSAAIQVGKALNDPILGVSALAESGIQFSVAQKDVIRNLQESGRVAEAQTLILQELESQFGGSAAAARDTLGGALEGLSNTWDDLFEAESGATGSMVEGINSVEAAISSPEFKDGIALIVTGMTSMFTLMVDISGKASEFGEGIAGAIDHARTEWGLFNDALDEAGEALTEASNFEEIRARLLREGAQATTEATTATKANNKELLQEIKVQATRLKQTTAMKKAEKELEKALAKQRKEREKEAAQLKKNLESNEALLESIEFEIELLGMSEERQEVERELRKLNADATDEQRQRLEELVIARRKATREAEAEEKALEKNTKAQEEAAEASAKAWEDLNEVVGGVFETLLSDGEVSFEQLAKSFSGLISKMELDAENADFGDFGTNAALLGVGAVANSLNDKQTTGAGALVGAAIGAYYGGEFGAAAGAAIGDALESSLFGQDNDGDNSAAGSINLNTGEREAFGVGNSFSQANVDGVVEIINTIRELEGVFGDSNFGARISVGTNSGVRINDQALGSNPDDVFAFLFDAVVAGAHGLDESLKSLLTNFEGTREEVLAFTDAILALSANAELNSVALAIEDFENSQRTLLETYNASSTQLNTLITNYDGSLAATDEISAALIENQKAAYSFATSIRAIGQAISDVAEAQARSIRESVMSVEDLRAVRQNERDELRQSLSTLVDPAEIEQASQRILELNRQIFDSLGEEQKLLRAEEFAQIAEGTAETARVILDAAEESALARAEEMNAKIRDMLNKAADTQQKAAETALAASRQMLQAARTPTRVIVETVSSELI